MNIKKLISALLLLVVGTTTTLFAQTAVSVGSQVTSESAIVSGKAYLIKYTSMTGTPYIYDAGTATPLQAPSTQNAATTACAFYFISDGNGAFKLENVYTGCYWPAPTGNERLYPTTAANAGSWSIAISNGTATLTCTNGGTTYGLDRLTPDVVGWSSRNTVEIYEINAADLSTAATYSAFTGKDISVSATEAASISEGQWYVMSQRSRTSYVFENTSDHKLKHTRTKPSGSATEKAGYLVRLLSADGGKYYLQNGFGNYMGTIAASTNVPTTALGQEAITVAKIGGTDGHFYLQGTTNGVILDGNDFTLGDPSTVVGWGTGAPSTTGGNNDWAFYPVEFVDSWVPTISEVYTINNTNSNRGAMMYNGSSSYVWSSGKSGTFSATDPNCQWVIIPTAIAKQYYLYNVGAGKFAIPSGTASTASWIFSSDAVAVTFVTQGDGTKKIKTVTTDTYAAVSNGFDGPIINYNDVGGNFTITKVDGDQSAAATAAVNKLVDNVSPLTAIPADGTSDWYVIRIKTHSTYADKYVYPVVPEITYNGTNYPFSFDHGANIRPAINDANYYTRITREGNKVYWQMPNGKYLYGANNKFPVSTLEKSAFSMDYTNGSGFRVWGGSRYAIPYYLGSQYFIGETANSGNAYYDIYPIDLSAAGLKAWQVICDNAPDNAQITCSRSDVSGLTSVYKNGYFFLPAGVTPEAGDFTLDGANGVTIDATAKTITFAYDPNLAIVADGVSVAQGWQTAGRDSEVMLLKVKAAPFKAATGVTLTVNLKDGSEANISSLKLYEASSASPEIYSTGTGAPTKTEVATANISGSTATFSIGNLSVGTHYYWIGATVKSDATLGAVIDAAVTGITYTCNENETTLDLTSVGDPADRGAMVFNTRSYPFLPRDNGSRVYRIPAMVVAKDGSIVAAVDKRYDSHTDIGKGHVIDIVVRRSTNGGKTWGEPVIVAKGDNSSDATCGYGDPSLYKDNDGKLYLLFAAGNTGYFYGLKRVCLSTSSDNGATWTAPVDLYETSKLTDHASSYGSNTCYGLYDYFVTSGRGLCTSEGYLMALLPAEVYTTSEKSSSAKNGNHDYIFYSTDKGATWHISENAIFTGGDEAKVIQMNDGSLLASVRQGGNRGFNTATYTLNNDGTLTFTMGTQWNNSQLNAGGYANNQDIFYYQRETDEGKTDVIFHSMTTGQHANLKLYYSTDKGQNWTEFLNVQTKGTRYVTMEKSATGDLYLLFEDQSLNSAGDYTDYNHYPINFLEITRDQLVSLIPELDHLVISTEEVKIAYDNVAPSTYGDWTILGGVWRQGGTSSDASGVAGLSLQSTYTGAFNQAQNIYSKYVLALKVSATNAIDQITLTAPDGYAIKGYSLNARSYNGGKDYTLSSGETSLTTVYNEWRTFSASNIYAKSTSFSIATGQEQTNYLCVSDFIVTLVPLTDYTRSTTEGNFGTICLPYDVISYTGAKFYKVAGKMMDGDALSYITLEEVAEPKGGVGYLFQAEGTELIAYYVETGVLAEIENPTSTGLVGSYESQYIPQGGYMLKNNKVYYVDKENYAKVGVNRAYFDLSNIGEADESQAKLVRLVNGDLATGISRVQTEVADEAVFNLAGQRVSKTTKGVYIINGKKVAVK